MKTNFEIIENYALSYEGKHIDLHNNFDFVDFKYDLINCEVVLTWKKSTGNWIADDELLGLYLRHKSVTFLKVIEQEENLSPDRCCLSEITFFPSDLSQTNDSFVSQANPDENNDVIYSFENGQRIRIRCMEIELCIGEAFFINLTKNESLVLFEFLAKINQGGYSSIFQDESEQKLLWLIEGQLEKALVEPFKPNYRDILSEARNQIRKGL